MKKSTGELQSEFSNAVSTACEPLVEASGLRKTWIEVRRMEKLPVLFLRTVRRWWV